MQGFFSLPKGKDVKILKAHNPKTAPVLNCELCGLHRQCKSPKMKPTGEGRKRILIVAEAPGRTEDEQGTQLIGQAGQVLRRNLASMGVDLDRDCRKTNAVCCRPPGNRTPTPREVACCRRRLWEEIRGHRPRLIIVLGATAAKSFLQNRWRKDFPEISELRGWVIPDRDAGCWVSYSFHPSYILYSQGNPNVEATFKRDLGAAIRHRGEPFPKLAREERLVRILKKEREVMECLLRLMHNPPELLAVDYETSGLKPYREGHFIRTCALAWREGSNPTAVAFEMTERILPHFKARILQNPEIQKVAQHIPHEEAWSRQIAGCRVSKWAWDTAIAAHVLDNRSGTAGLKFQTYVQYGLANYSSEIAHYLASGDDKDGNAFNEIQKAPIDRLLLYNGIDTIITLRQAYRQRRQIEMQKGYGYDLLHQGMLALCNVEAHGMRINRGHCRAELARIEEKIKEYQDRIGRDLVVRKWRAREKEGFSFRSSTQLRRVLFGRKEDGGLELAPVKFTKNEKAQTPSTDKEVLAQLADRVGFLRLYQEAKKLETPRNFLLGWLREAVDGVLHPQFSLVSVDTFRSSCTHPNLQNVPRRDEEMNAVLRRAIYPSRGRKLIEADFKGIEVAVSACYHRDPNMIAYLKDKRNNMHTDTGADLFKLPKGEVSKPIRDIAKNGFVFPTFYGSYYEDTAPAMWKTVGKFNPSLRGGRPLLEHMRESGIGTLRQFAAHVQRTEDRFWNERFPVYHQWRRDMEREYLRKGYLETLTGFRCSGPLRRNQIVNYPIQGSAFHCLLWVLTELDKWLRRGKLQSRICSQIHDSMVIDTVPEEEERVVRKLRSLVSIDLPQHWPWIIVPMEVEIEAAPVDRPWYEKKPLEEQQ